MIAHLNRNDHIWMMYVNVQMREFFAQIAAQLRADLRGFEREFFIRPLRLHLKRGGLHQLWRKVFARNAQNLAHLLGRLCGAAETGNAEHAG